MVGIPSGLNGVYGASSVAGERVKGVRVKGNQCRSVPKFVIRNF